MNTPQDLRKAEQALQEWETSASNLRARKDAQLDAAKAIEDELFAMREAKAKRLAETPPDFNVPDMCPTCKRPLELVRPKRALILFMPSPAKAPLHQLGLQPLLGPLY